MPLSGLKLHTFGYSLSQESIIKTNKQKLHDKLKQDGIYRMYNYYRFSLRMYVLRPLQQRIKKI